MRERLTRVTGSFLSRNRVVLAGASKTLAGSMGARAATMLSALGAAGLLGVEGYGVYAFLVATVGLSSGIGLLGLAPIVSREIARAPGGSASTFAMGTLVATAVVSTVAAAISVLALEEFDIGGVAAVIDGWMGLGLVAWTTATGVSTIAQAVLVGRQWFTSASVLLATRSITVAAATVAGALSGDLERTALVVLATECVIALGTLGYLRSQGLIVLPAGSSNIRADLAVILRIGSGAGVASLLVQLSLWGASAWLMSQEGGAAANGALAVALRLALGAAVIPTALTTVLMPILSSGRRDVARRDSVVMPTLIAVLCAVAVAVLLPYLLTGWLDDYRAFSAVFYVMLVGTVAMVANETVGAVALSAGRTRSWVLSDVVLAISMALVYWPLVPSAGALGVAVAHVLAYLASTVVLLWAVAPARAADGRTAGPREELA